MTSKTWFLPPDFTFLPDGQITLGAVIPDPRRPTVTLASLGPGSKHPTIALPEVKTIIEKNRSFSTEQSRSFGFELLTKFMELASANGKADVSWYKNKAFSAVDHEVRSYNGAFTPEALKAVVELEEVKRHINSGRFAKRCVYIISGLRVARESFTVTDEKGKKTAASVGGSGPVPAGTVPIEMGGSISGSREDKRTDDYDTAPGIVFAYRLHVIRPKGEAGVEGELFSDRTAFFTGEAEDEEDEEELELIEVNAAALRQDLDLEPEFDDHFIGDRNDGSYIVFKPGTGKGG